jgi:hypothetical protein
MQNFLGFNIRVIKGLPKNRAYIMTKPDIFGKFQMVILCLDS